MTPSGPMVRPERHSRSSLPRLAPISNLDLDVTERCNLRCIYCFKGAKGERDMPLSVGKAAVDWLMEASGDTTDLQINFMGGEPLLCFRELLAPLVQYGHRKARSLGKAITFTATTNLTLVTQEMVDLWDRFNCGWLCSIDGTPEIQNAQRPFAGGGGSASEAERGARLILRTRPHLSVRSTIHPSHVKALAECFRHLIHLGFPLVIMALSDTHLWSGRKLTLLEEQLEKVRLEITEHLRRGCRAALSGFDYMISEILLPMREGRDLSPIPMSCGAGRGSAMIDPAGTLWPCHRFNSADRDTGATGAHSLGNLHGEFKDSLQ
ncbi:4Fe-4S cluster-binding domain-containing protein, partial [Candidatus Sumerlaeota bacterium]|nr:4Fe-4S cluster-binding domain-containing protein [Candidatus Sumerlaeota bacterium]